MESIKQKFAKLNLFEKEWDIVFTVNVIDEIQDHFDIHINEIFKKLDVKERDFHKNVAYVTMTLINEQIRIKNKSSDIPNTPYDLEIIRGEISNINIFICFSAILDAYSLSFMKAEKKEGDSKSPNL